MLNHATDLSQLQHILNSIAVSTIIIHTVAVQHSRFEEVFHVFFLSAKIFQFLKFSVQIYTHTWRFRIPLPPAADLESGFFFFFEKIPISKSRISVASSAVRRHEGFQRRIDLDCVHSAGRIFSFFVLSKFEMNNFEKVIGQLLSRICTTRVLRKDISIVSTKIRSFCDQEK